jgi:hypothetical protein
VNFDDVVDACKQANAYDFVMEGNFGLKEEPRTDPNSEIELREVGS